jgi:hypothetical protein
VFVCLFCGVCVEAWVIVNNAFAAAEAEFDDNVAKNMATIIA